MKRKKNRYFSKVAEIFNPRKSAMSAENPKGEKHKGIVRFSRTCYKSLVFIMQMYIIGMHYEILLVQYRRRNVELIFYFILVLFWHKKIGFSGTILQVCFWQKIVKVAFFQKVWCIFLIAKKKVPKTILKKRFWNCVWKSKVTRGFRSTPELISLSFCISKCIPESINLCPRAGKFKIQSLG